MNGNKAERDFRSGKNIDDSLSPTSEVFYLCSLKKKRSDASFSERKRESDGFGDLFFFSFPLSSEYTSVAPSSSFPPSSFPMCVSAAAKKGEERKRQLFRTDGGPFVLSNRRKFLSFKKYATCRNFACDLLPSLSLFLFKSLNILYFPKDFV